MLSANRNTVLCEIQCYQRATEISLQEDSHAVQSTNLLYFKDKCVHCMLSPKKL